MILLKILFWGGLGGIIASIIVGTIQAIIALSTKQRNGGE